MLPSAPAASLAALIVVCLPVAALASPYETGGPNPAEHFELKTILSGKAEGPEREGVAPSVELAMPATEDLELSVKVQRAVARDENHAIRTGFGDVELGAKWAVFREGEDGHAFALTVAPGLVTPTGEASRGLSDGSWALELPVVVGRAFSHFELRGQVAYEHVFNSDADEVGASGLLAFQVSEALEIGTELAADASTADMRSVHWRANVGFKRGLTPGLELQGLIGRSLNRDEDGRHLIQAKLVVEYAFH